MFRLGAIAGLCLLASAAVSATPAVSISVPAGEILLAGSVVEVRWHGVARDVEEVELLLSLDGGRTSVRLTEQLSSGSGSYFWTVPDLAARRASLILRMGIRGQEIESEPSERFDIGGGSGTTARVAFNGGELWIVPDDDARDEHPRPASGLATRENRWAVPEDSADSIELPGGGADLSTTDGGPSRPVGMSASRKTTRVAPGNPASRFLALRI